MWRVTSPMRVSIDVIPINNPELIVGVPPVWYDPEWDFLTDDAGDFLIDPIDDFYLVD